MSVVIHDTKRDISHVILRCNDSRQTKTGQMYAMSKASMQTQLIGNTGLLQL